MSEPPITIQAFHDDGPGNLTPTRVVIHATCPGVGFPAASGAGLARSTANYFTTARAGGSAHYVVDVAGEEHCVADSHIAWHAPPNPHSVGIEICGEATYSRDEWLSPQVWPGVVRGAARCAELCHRFGIPAVKLSVAQLLQGRWGVVGHVDVTNAWHQSTHTDPGPDFPWDRFMAAVTGDQPAPLPQPGPAPVTPSGHRHLQYGMMGDPDVRRVQAFMAHEFPSYAGNLPATGNYLDMTAAVILDFQHRCDMAGSDVTGRDIGPRTWGWLDHFGFH